MVRHRFRHGLDIRREAMNYITRLIFTAITLTGAHIAASSMTKTSGDHNTILLMIVLAFVIMNDFRSEK
jgi:hypothetical protein